VAITYIRRNNLRVSETHKIMTANAMLKYKMKIIWIMIAIIMISIVAAQQTYSTDKIIANCVNYKLVAGLDIQPFLSVDDALQQIKYAKRYIHPDIGNNLENVGEAMNCIAMYKECVNDQYCFVFANFYGLNQYQIGHIIVILLLYLAYLVFILTMEATFEVANTVNDLCSSIFINTSKMIRKIRKNACNPELLKTLFVYAIVGYVLSFAKTATVNKTNFYNKIVHSSCIVDVNYDIPIDPEVKWEIQEITGKPYEYGDASLGLCNCQYVGSKKKMYKIADYEDVEKPVLYHSCWANNISAIARMCYQMPRHDGLMLRDFDHWFDRIFKNEIQETITDIVIDEVAWYNHLNAKKQKEVECYFEDTTENPKTVISVNDIPAMTQYTNFVKSEKQFGNKPKTRCICSPIAAYKYIAGPATYALEQIFKKNFKGYKVPLTWGEQEAEIDSFAERGLNATIQLDGKGFDLTQRKPIKDIVDKKIYELVSQSVTHTTPEIFMKTILPDKRTIIPSVLIDKKIHKFGRITLPGKTFSGSCDTTLMNTIRMACYTRFAVDLVKVEDYEVWVKGDDTVIFARESDVENIVKGINKVFVTEKEWLDKPNIIKGLGQISKFIKTGGLIDFDFCSTMCINTKEGYKILRKMDNVLNREHYSVQIGQMDPRAYHNDLNISAKAWLGKYNTHLSDYFQRVHPYTPGIKVINKEGAIKKWLKSEYGNIQEYKPQLIHFDYEILETRISSKSFTNEELEENLNNMIDDEQLTAYKIILSRLDL
jgi:hypothetical protein